MMTHSWKALLAESFSGFSAALTCGPIPGGGTVRQCGNASVGTAAVGVVIRWHEGNDCAGRLEGAGEHCGAERRSLRGVVRS